MHYTVTIAILYVYSTKPTTDIYPVLFLFVLALLASRGDGWELQQAAPKPSIKCDAPKLSELRTG
jgi:hypothetical protein